MFKTKQPTNKSFEEQIKVVWEILVKPKEIAQDFFKPFCLFVYYDPPKGWGQVPPRPFGSETHSFSPMEYLLVIWGICQLVLSGGGWVHPGVLPGQPFHGLPSGTDSLWRKSPCLWYLSFGSQLSLTYGSLTHFFLEHFPPHSTPWWYTWALSLLKQQSKKWKHFAVTG